MSRFLALLLLIPSLALADSWEADHAARVARDGNGNPCKPGQDDGVCYKPKPRTGHMLHKNPVPLRKGS
jgi:hypothetical protein